LQPAALPAPPPLAAALGAVLAPLLEHAAKTTAAPATSAATFLWMITVAYLLWTYDDVEVRNRPALGYHPPQCCFRRSTPLDEPIVSAA
jgi:hypothetical protein